MAQLAVVVFALFFVAALAEPLLPKVDNEERIIGGYTATDGQFPYQVALRMGGGHFCGGSIISCNWILTAAHCTYEQSARDITIVVGTNRLDNGGTSYKVSQIIIHFNYDPQNFTRDISLLRVSDRISYNIKVQPIKLAISTPAPGSKYILSGWGLTSFPSQNFPNDLQYIYLRSISVAHCQSELPGYPVFNTNVCTLQRPGQGACPGDSGSPLVSDGVLVGIVSWVIPCATGKPDVFTAVPNYRDWILSVIRE